MPVNTYWGLDTSTWQGQITQEDVDAAKQAGKTFWYFKGSGGDDGTYVDAQFTDTLNIVRLGGFKLGVYHFAGMTDAAAEANYAVANVWKRLLPSEVPILDVDRAFPADPSWTAAFCDVADAALGVPVVLYMNQNTENSYDWKGAGLTNRGLIIADYAVSPAGDVALKNWPFYLGQQYSSSGTVGALSPVDLDAVWLESLDDWNKYGLPVPPSVPVPAPSEVVTPTPPPPAMKSTGGTAIDVVVKPTPQPAPAPAPAPVPVVPEPVTPTKKGSPMAKYSKFLVALAGVVLTWLSVHYKANVVVQDAMLVATALGVYHTPNQG